MTLGPKQLSSPLPHSRLLAQRRSPPGAPPHMARRHLRHRLVAQRADRKALGLGAAAADQPAALPRPLRAQRADPPLRRYAATSPSPSPSPSLSHRHSPPHFLVRATASPAKTPSRPSDRPVQSQSPRPHPTGLAEDRSRGLLLRPRPARRCRRRSPSAPLVGRAAAPGLGVGGPCLSGLRRAIAPPRNDPGPRRRAPRPHPPRPTHGVPTAAASLRPDLSPNRCWPPATDRHTAHATAESPKPSLYTCCIRARELAAANVR